MAYIGAMLGVIIALLIGLTYLGLELRKQFSYLRLALRDQRQRIDELRRLR